MTWITNWIVDETDQEMMLRVRPLREHWEARGPGMLTHVQKSCSWLALPAQVNVRLVAAKDGGGTIVSANSIEFQAVLFNPLPQLPEVVRLAWLWSCLSVDQEPSQQLAVIPPILDAAEHVELARSDATTVQQAVVHWLGLAEFPASQLLDWWRHQRPHINSLDQFKFEI